MSIEKNKMVLATYFIYNIKILKTQEAGQDYTCNNFLSAKYNYK